MPTRNKCKDTERLSVKYAGSRKIYQKKTGVAILISDKAAFRSWKIIREWGTLHKIKEIDYLTRYNSKTCMYLTREYSQT